MDQDKALGELPTGGECELSAVTQQTKEPGEATEGRAPDAGEATEQTRKQVFRSLMEGEYKDLFKAYFQETFNRRFREQKEIREELERARAVVEAAAERFGVRDEAALAAAIRDARPAEQTDTRAAEEATEHAVQQARDEAVRAVLDSIRARGLRPAENALHAVNGTHAGAASHLSRAQRAEMARRAARGERIEF